MSDHLDALRAALQALLDYEGDGWHVGHYVVVLGIERVGEDNTVESGVWTAAPKDQAEYVSTGLLETAVTFRSACVCDTADDDD